MQSAGRACSEMLLFWTKILMAATAAWCLDQDIKAGRMLQLIQEDPPMDINETHIIKKRNTQIWPLRFGPNAITLRWGDKIDIRFYYWINIKKSNPKKLHMRLSQDQVREDKCENVGVQMSPIFSKVSLYVFFCHGIQF